MNSQRTECPKQGRLTIGKLARAAGISVTTVRYYQRRGLLTEPAKPWGGVRHYGERELERLAFIGHAKAIGFTLAEIAKVINHAEQQDCCAVKSVFEQKQREIARRLRLLNKARRTVKALLQTCRPETSGASCRITCPMMSKEPVAQE